MNVNANMNAYVSNVSPLFLSIKNLDHAEEELDSICLRFLSISMAEAFCFRTKNTADHDGPVSQWMAKIKDD